MVGFGSFERAVGALEQHLAATEWVCGERFTMADVLVGAQVDWGLTFGTLPARAALAAYAERCRARPAYRKGKAIDQALLDQHVAP
ncbi:glutathione S-transferase C-terminal domain-containing protein [Novosphingobium pokkalii]|uniref:Glutathione S-transferase C-terminal domain-containing protein n=1 Tax=Novosphingobium pokkalii TaxID=1770194 RepID=A0ABV7UYP1_9SPHN|nr:glutathione S-transferase C-terminal domain-containing protein [Novosphingobium pokkalii]GHC99089.1 hypothetical protein GCM10019060_31400 [Novosphingobium pokkalii]